MRSPTHRRNRWYTDRYGKPFWRWGGFWFTICLVLGIIALLAVIVVGAKVIQETGCNSKVERLNNPNIVDGDYDFWASICYVTMEDGRVIPLENFRVMEQEDGVIR